MKTISRLFFAFSLLLAVDAHAVLGLHYAKTWFTWPSRAKKECARKLTQETFTSNREAMKAIQQSVPKFVKSKGHTFLDVLDGIIAATEYDSPAVVVTNIGAVSSGKSTVTNAVEAKVSGLRTVGIDRPRASVSIRPDETKRTLLILGKQMPTAGLLENPDVLPIAANDSAAEKLAEKIHANKEFTDSVTVDATTGQSFVMQDIMSRFPNLQNWTKAEDTRVFGAGLIVESEYLPPHLAIGDVPGYTNDPKGKLEAEATLRRSNIIQLVTDMTAIANDLNVDVLRKAIDGAGKKEMILIYRGSLPDIGREGDPDRYRLVTANLIDCVDAIYDSGKDDFPREILGAYFMPWNDGVAAGHVHPDFIPLPIRKGKMSLPYGELMKSIAENAYAHKEFSQVEASKMVQSEVEDEIHDAVKGHLATQIYREALDAMVETISEKQAVRFPYYEHKDTIVSKRMALDHNQWWYWPEKILDLFSELPWRKMSPKRKTLPREQAGVQNLEDPKLINQNAYRQSREILDAYAEMLKTGEVNLTHGVKAEKVLGSASEFYRRFPEEKGADVRLVPKIISFRLPSLELLSPEARTAISSLAEYDVKVEGKILMDRLKNLETESLRMANDKVCGPRTNAELRCDLASQGGTFLLGIMSGSAYAAAYHSHFLHWAVGYGVWAGAQNIYAWGVRDKINIKRINGEYLTLQKMTIETYLTERIASAMKALRKVDLDEWKAIRRAEHAMHYLDPGYEPFSDIVDTSSYDQLVPLEGEVLNAN